MQGFPDIVSVSGEEEWEILLGGFLSGIGYLRRSGFEHSNLSQS